MGKQGYSVNTERSKVERQYWLLRESPPSFLSWPGWLWLLGLLLLAIWGIFVTAPNIERQVEQSVAKQLSGNDSTLNFEDTRVSASGQHVLITAAGHGDKTALAEALAESAKCDTAVFGQLTCPVDVAIELSQSEQKIAEPVVNEPDSALQPRTHDFVVSGDENGIELVGEVPTTEVQRAISQELAHIHSEVDNQLQVSGHPSASEDVAAAKQAGQLLGLAEQGRVTWLDGVLSARLLAKSENAASIRALFDNLALPGQSGNLELQLIETVSRCDQEFAKLLSENSIQFQTGSARISPESNRLLGTIAELAGNCDMRLDVEGHTDSVGSAEMNKALSLARANSVIVSLAAHGANPERFTPYGYGSDKPIADNETADGRRLNRRIEIRVTKIN